ncbi:hypothetical protein [Streptomyces caatingaensis]|uniref:Uncharacterized protein n=1 Tax=Streptomyces caatingaensis TaxID=1678637 RepID=A0A0K9X715_9ACTN|nr:hypothetical protein [Streptomyces caatingaensis]KNB49220.1 hypothetical protein AC230_28325 [Streptomyces caatingaensis]
MGIFSKRSEIDHDERDRQIQEAKREGVRRLNEIADRIDNGTATREDKRVFNASRTRSGRVK